MMVLGVREQEGAGRLEARKQMSRDLRLEVIQRVNTNLYFPSKFIFVFIGMLG